jgi:hypothetical protein
MFEDILFSVTGNRYKSEAALLRDYRRYAIRDEVYPGIAICRGDSVNGMVYFNLTEADWIRLDLFEGGMYRRDTIEVAFADGREAKAQTYVVRAEYSVRLSRSQWNPEEFLRSGKAQFQSQYRGFEILKSKKSI